eukprot:scaffold33485_cov35-Tisochrysis_lutea.AAC.2
MPRLLRRHVATYHGYITGRITHHTCPFPNGIAISPLLHKAVAFQPQLYSTCRAYRTCAIDTTRDPRPNHMSRNMSGQQTRLRQIEGETLTSDLTTLSNLHST